MSSTANDSRWIEGNKLIAEFDGLEYDGNFWYRPTGNEEGLMYTHKYKQLRYHLSFDWLMPVVEKIEAMFEDSLVFYIKDKRAYIEMDTQASLVYKLPNVPECYCGFKDTKIEAVYDSIIQFIQWYNNQNKNNNG